MNETDATTPQGEITSGTAAANAAASEEYGPRLQNLPPAINDSERPAGPTLHDPFLDERDDVMQVINELEDQLDRQQEVRAALERELSDAQDKLQAATQRSQELEWQAVSLQTRIDSLEQARQEVALLEEEIASANARVQRLNEEHKGTEKERARLRNELKAANKQLEELWALRKERDGLRTDAKNLAARIEELERSQRDLVEERGQFQTRLAEAQATLEETLAERQQHQTLVRSVEDRNRELARIQEELTDKVETARAEKKTLQAQLTHLERENIRLIEQRQYYETELASLRNSNRSAEAALAGVKKAFAEVRVALTETKARVRRRLIESWPRIGTPLRGLENADAALQRGDLDDSGLDDMLDAGEVETAALFPAGTSPPVNDGGAV